MEENIDHGELIKKAAEHLKKMFDESEQSIYLFLDDSHKVCNEKFASLLGYKSPNEWSEVKKSFTEAYVADSSKKILVLAYQKAMEGFIGSSIEVEWKKKNNDKVRTKVILVPFLYDHHLFALHFIS